ncbi:MAG: aldo/keto reductase [Clostridia bacterium]|nr:aldo/keto reductase [Clostridia bacterium]
MEMREIGHSGIVVNGLGLGCWAIGGGSWWGENDDRTSVDTIYRAVHLGVEWIDTARVYGFGHSEEVIGRALHSVPRHKVILSTKCALQWNTTEGEYHFSRDGHDVYRNLTPQSIRNDLELSLKALGTDYIDVLYTHWQCREYGLVPVDETMSELIRMKKEGTIRAIGASNVNLQVLRDYASSGELDVIQEKLSILDRKAETELLPFCEEHGISLQTYSTLEQGLLAGRTPDSYVPRPGEVREGRKWWQPEGIRLANQMLAGWSDLAASSIC